MILHDNDNDRESEDLRLRLAEAEGALAALRTGAADALLGETGVLYLDGANSTYVTFFSAMNEGGVTLDGAGTILHCNPRFAAMMGLSAEELRGRSLLSCVIDMEQMSVAALLKSTSTTSIEVTLKSAPDGASEVGSDVAPVRVSLVQLSVTPLSTGQNQFVCLVVSDLTRRMLAEHELERLIAERTGKLRLASSVIENTMQGVMVTDMHRRILSVNPAFSDITGFSATEAVGSTPRILRSQHHSTEFYAQLWHALQKDGHWRGEIWNRRKNGNAYLQWTTINHVLPQYDEPDCYVAVFTDATELWSKNERIAHLAYHDHLTDLPNRTLLLDRLNHALAATERQGNRLGVLFIDLDGFKAINDNLGHHVGDQLLQEVANRLKASVRNSDTVARIGGDEFVVIMEELELAAECAVLAQKLCLALTWEAPAGKHPHPLRTGASIGIAVYPEDGIQAASLLQRADAALYSAKASGKGGFRYFEHGITHLTQETT